MSQEMEVRAEGGRSDCGMSDYDRELFARMQQVTQPYSYAELNRLTGVNREACRRYLTQECRPSTQFLSLLCEAIGVSVHWMLLGVGPCRREDVVENWLVTVKPADLLMEIGRRWREQQADLTDLRARVTRLEAAVAPVDAKT